MSGMVAQVPTEERIPLDPSAAKKAAMALYIIVVVSGAVLMGVEIAGAKILAPSFGTSTFVWGSIIGLFMGALAAGYYLGGMLADKKPAFTVLASIVSAAGVWVWLIPRFGPDLSESIAMWNIGTTSGPLLAAFFIFFLPSLLMGMVSPYAIKLNARSLSGVGFVAGKLYAISTAGSIVGTLITTFMLIPSFAVSTVMQVLGLILIVVAVACLYLFRKATGTINRDDRLGISMMMLGALTCLEVSGIFPVEPHMHPGYRLLKYRDSSYHEILVTEDVLQHIDLEHEANNYDVSQDREARKANEWIVSPPKQWNPDDRQLPWFVHDVHRWLKFNDNTESGIFPYRSEYKNAVGYTDLLHLPLLWVNSPPPKKILVVGGGGGIVPTQYHNWYGTQVDIAEIDPAVREISMQYFDVREDGITFHIGDGRQTIRKELKDGDYDVIVLDAYSSGGQIPFHLLTWEFMKEIKAKLSKRGVLATNIISGIKNVTPTLAVHPADLFLAEYKTLKASRKEATGRASAPEDSQPLFKQVYVFPRVYPKHPLTGSNLEEYRNVIIVATNEDTPRTIDGMLDDAKHLAADEKATIGDSSVKGIPQEKIRELNWHIEHQWTHEKGPKDDELTRIPILTDDYAPVDLMYRPVKKDENRQDLY